MAKELQESVTDVEYPLAPVEFSVADRALIIEAVTILREFKSLIEALAPMAGAMGIPVPGLASGSEPAVSPW